MLELNERYSDVTFSLMEFDLPREILLQQQHFGMELQETKCWTLTKWRDSMCYTPSMSKCLPPLWEFNLQEQPIRLQDQVFTQGTVNTQQSRATRIVKFLVPGKKFTRSGILQYENNSQQVKFFDHHFMIYAYSNFTPVAGLNFAP